jgi:hypothetical protein
METNILVYKYNICQFFISRTDPIKVLRVLWFLNFISIVISPIHFPFIHTKLLCLVLIVTITISSIKYMCILYFALFRSKLECAFVVWNSLTSSDAYKLECNQHKFAAPYFNSSFSQVLMLESIWNGTSYVVGGMTAIQSSLFKATLALKSTLLFRKLLVFKILLGISENFCVKWLLLY